MSTKKKNPIVYEKSETINNTDLLIYVEQLGPVSEEIDRKEFIFSIDGTTKRQDHELTIGEMYEILTAVIGTLYEYIDKHIEEILETSKKCLIEFEADGSTKQERDIKNKCYSVFLQRLQKKIDDQFDNIKVEYTRDNYLHWLKFSTT